jgi:hypothetical protein
MTYSCAVGGRGFLADIYKGVNGLWIGVGKRRISFWADEALSYRKPIVL